MRSFCLYKHAWMLIDSIDGAKSSAIVYSITEKVKANNLNPFRYLEYVLIVMKDHQEDTDYRFMEDLLPWSGQLPEQNKNNKCVNRPSETAVKNKPVLMFCRVLQLGQLVLHGQDHCYEGFLVETVQFFR